MIEDTKYQEIVNKLTSTIETIKTNTETFDETTNKLNEWILKEHNFKQSVDILISRLEEIENIKDINKDFWNQTREQLNEGVSLIANASEDLRDTIEVIQTKKETVNVVSLMQENIEGFNANSKSLQKSMQRFDDSVDHTFTNIDKELALAVEKLSSFAHIISDQNRRILKNMDTLKLEIEEKQDNV